MCLPTKPFKVEREWEHAGLKCAITQGHEGGHRCGYVRVPPGHWAHGKEYGQIDVRVHGGVTFAQPEPCEHEDGKGWWLGFDFGHSSDQLYDPNVKIKDLSNWMRDIVKFHRKMDKLYHPSKHYWTHEEVVKETEQFAEQLTCEKT